jgi:glycosyltransferase involved in cell wall biosynthesis
MSSQAAVTPKLKIAILNRHFGHRFGGAESYSAAVVELLANRHDIHVYAQEIEHSFPGVTYHRIKRPITKPRWINQLWFSTETWWRTRRGFDVVHSHENTWHGDIQTIHVRPFRIGLFHNRKGLKRVARLVSLLLSPRLMAYWLLEGARFRPQPGRQIVATSDQVLKEIRRAYPNDTRPIHVITPGVLLPYIPSDIIKVRKQIGLPTQAPIALFVANDFGKKGLGTLLHTLPLIPELHLAVAGKGLELNKFKHQSEQLQLSKRVHFLGSLTDISSAYVAADILVHPTTEDTYAMVVLEAMAHNLPVIVSREPYCGVAAELSHGENALILENPFDINAIASEIRLLLYNDTLRKTIQSNGFIFAMKNEWSQKSMLYESLYEKSRNTQRHSNDQTKKT